MNLVKAYHSVAQRSTFQLAIVWLLTLPALWYSLNAASELRVDVGQWGDHTAVRGVHGREANPFENYRWTEAHTTITFPNLNDRYRILQIRAHGWRPEGIPTPCVRIMIAGRQWGAFQAERALRTYMFLLPGAALSPTIEASLISETYTPPDDTRTIGIAIDWIALDALDIPSNPATGQFVGQALLLGLALALIVLLALPSAVAAVCGLLASATLVGLNIVEPLWAGLGLIHWLVVVALLAGATWLVSPHLVRALERMTSADPLPRLSPRAWITLTQVRIAWALLVAALLVRLTGAVHPLFDARDVHVHTRWLKTVARGQLFFYSTPAEFQNRQTFNPPAAYIVLLPLHLALGDMRLTVQAGVAALDALIAPLLLLIARELGLSARAGLFAMALYVALPIAMTMMWWGFAANAIAQVWWVLLFWLLLRLTRSPDRSLFALFTITAVLCLTTHIGALVTLITFLGVVVSTGWRVLPRCGWRAMVAGLLLAGLFAAPMYFIAAAAPLANDPRSPATLDLVASFVEGLVLWPERVDLVQRALTLGFLPPILALAAVGLPLLFTACQRHPLQRILVMAMLAVCVVFFLSYVFLQLLTRYIYFATPLVCLAAGAALARLAVRPGGRWIAYSLTLFVAWSGVALWFGGVLLRIKPSLVPLTQ
ncbi:MAG: hypothetical protein NZ699_02935 [Roseiflexus sp.]|nr:hypothetical protein [Roseiflexus sp.]MCS7288069.1 hypothetical protein [Roseiflexus sp.]MDW8148086.1 hypothetical protein [Roseiflexaceae bacterium]MDW8233409.1 hypothetical protein [Roseiflexaceae bacterium]